MRTDNTDQEGTENRVYTNNGGEEGRRKDHKHRQSHDRLCGAILQTTSALQKSNEEGSDGVHEEEDVANGDQEDVESRNARSSINEGDAERQEDPANDIVPNTSGKHNHANLRLQ